MSPDGDLPSFTIHVTLYDPWHCFLSIDRAAHCKPSTRATYTYMYCGQDRRQLSTSALASPAQPVLRHDGSLSWKALRGMSCSFHNRPAKLPYLPPLYLS